MKGSGILFFSLMMIFCLSGTTLVSAASPDYQVKGDNINKYPSNQTVFTIYGNSVKKYPSNQTVLMISGNDVRKYPTNQTLLTVSGNNIKDSSNRTIGKIKGDTITINDKRIEIKGVSKYNSAVCAALALALLDPLM